VEEFRRRAYRFLRTRHFDACLTQLSLLAECVTNAFDLDLLKYAHSAMGLVHYLKEDYKGACGHFRVVRDIGGEDDDFGAKLYGYEKMGRCYIML